MDRLNKIFNFVSLSYWLQRDRDGSGSESYGNGTGMGMAAAGTGRDREQRIPDPCKSLFSSHWRR